MLQNAHKVEELLITNGKGKKAQVGYDLTLESINKVKGGKVLKDGTHVEPYINMETTTIDGKEVYQLKPGTYSLTFEQGVKLPTNYTAFIRHRSSVLRCGGIITSGVYDSGFEVDQMGAVLIATENIEIERGARVAQIIVFENVEAEAYNGQWQGSKDVK